MKEFVSKDSSKNIIIEFVASEDSYLRVKNCIGDMKGKFSLLSSSEIKSVGQNKQKDNFSSLESDVMEKLFKKSVE